MNVTSSLPLSATRGRARRADTTTVSRGHRMGAGGISTIRRFDDSNAKVFRGDVGRSELRSVYMLVYTRPRGLSQFAHMGPLQSAVSRGARGTASAVGPAAGSVSRFGRRNAGLDAVIADWSLEIWQERAQFP